MPFLSWSPRYAAVKRMFVVGLTGVRGRLSQARAGTDWIMCCDRVLWASGWVSAARRLGCRSWIIVVRRCRSSRRSSASSTRWIRYRRRPTLPSTMTAGHRARPASLVYTRPPSTNLRKSNLRQSIGQIASGKLRYAVLGEGGSRVT